MEGRQAVTVTAGDPGGIAPTYVFEVELWQIVVDVP